MQKKELQDFAKFSRQKKNLGNLCIESALLFVKKKKADKKSALLKRKKHHFASG